MSDKKLTDNEIIKALKHCADTNCNCEKCSLYVASDDDCECARKLKLEALDLINRLQAENERLKKGWKADVILTANIKAEAYKECIEKVKMEAENATCVYEPDRPQADNMVYHISNIRLNNLLKELVGDEDES